MSDEIKNNNPDEAKVETIADKLNSAAQTLNEANAEAKLRREEERKKQALAEKEERARRDEEEKRRAEEEKKNQAMMRKKQAELEYAENYRKKLREEKERAQLLAAKRRAAKKKAEEERLKKEAEELARKTAEEAGLEEAKRRNAESDSLVDVMSNKAKENEKAQAELEAKRREAKERAEAEANAALLRQLEASKRKDGPIIITADGIELFPGSDGYEEALAMGARIKDEAPAEPDAAAEDNDAAEALASEELLRAINEKIKEREASAAEKPEEPAEDKPEASDEAPAEPIEEKPEEPVEEKPEEPEDYIISLEGDPIPEEPDYDDEEPVAAAQPTPTPEPAPAPAPESAPAPAPAPAAEEPSALDAYLFSSTYDMMKKTSDFGEDYAEKKRENEDNLTRYREADGGDVAADLEDVDGKYKYDAGEVLRREDFETPKEPRREKKNKGKPSPAAAADESFDEPVSARKEDGDDSAAVGAVAGAVAAGTVAAIGLGAAAVAEDDEKIAKLLEKKAKLEEELRETEEKNRAEIASLTEKEQAAKRAALEADLAAKEEKYQKEIDELNRKLEDLERSHSERKATLESAISDYESRQQRVVDARNHEKFTERRQLDETNAANQINGAVVATLSAKELSKFLNSQDKKERSLVSSIDSSKKKYRKAKGNNEKALTNLHDAIESERELLGSYVLSYKHTLAANHKKYSSSYSGKVKSLVKDYNMDLKTWRALTDTEVGELPTTLADDIKAGREIPPVPHAYYPGEYAAAPAAAPERYDEPYGDERAEMKLAAGAVAEGAGVAALTSSELKRFLSKQEVGEKKLISEIESLRKNQKKAKGYEPVRCLKACINKEAELLDSYATDYKAITVSNGKKYKKQYREKLVSLTETYNADLEKWRALTESPVTLAPTTVADDIEAGREVLPFSTVAADYAEFEDSKKKSEVKPVSAKEQYSDEVRRFGEKTNVEAMSKKDLKAYLNKCDSAERKLIKESRDARSKQKKATGDRRISEIKRCLDAECALINGYMDTYRITVLSGIRKYSSRYSKKLNSALKQYKSDAKLWTNATNMTVDMPKKTLVSDIKNTGEYEYLTPISYMDRENAYAPERNAKRERADEVSEQKRFLRDEEQRAKRRKDRTGTRVIDTRDVLISATHMKADIATLENKVAYRCDKYSRHIELSEYRYGETKKKDKKRLNTENAKLTAMKRGKGAVIKNRKKNNKRYLEIIEMDTADIKRASKSDRERLRELQTRIEDILLERDEINTRLNSLYTEENLGVKKRKKRNFRAKLAGVRLSEVKRAFRSQRRNYRKISKFRVSLQQKQRVYDSMNRKIELTGYLAELKFRLKNEHAKGAARRAIKDEIKETKRSINRSNYDISNGIVKLGKRSAKTPNPKVQLLWLLLLLVIAAAIALVIVFRQPIIDYVMKLVGKFLPNK